MRILLIEDDAMICKAIRHGLGQAGFAVDWVTDGRAADLSLANGAYDLAILDLGLPNKDGMVILSTLRGMGNSMPVLIASAGDTVRDRIAGLKAGADDYVLGSPHSKLVRRNWRASSTGRTRGAPRPQALRQRRQGALLPRGVRCEPGAHHQGRLEVRSVHLRHR